MKELEGKTAIGVGAVMPGLIHTGMVPSGEDPAVVANSVIAGILHNRPYIYSDNYRTDEVNSRLQALQDARAYVSP
jgi:hypothetical protein